MALWHISAKDNTIHQIIHFGSETCQVKLLSIHINIIRAQKNVSVKLYCKEAQPPRPYRL